MKRSQVRALLRKARATIGCWGARAGGNRSARYCFATIQNGWFDLFVSNLLDENHRACASALLDGLDVRDVTEAGG